VKGAGSEDDRQRFFFRKDRRLPFNALLWVFNQESALLHVKDLHGIKGSLLFEKHFDKTKNYNYGKRRFNYQ
jgi:hypothetical protein